MLSQDPSRGYSNQSPTNARQPPHQHPSQTQTYPQPQFPNSTSAFADPPPEPPAPHPATDPQFDIFEWYPKYQSCQRYFLDHAQHDGPVLALAAFLNILLPSQRHPAIRAATTHPPSPHPTHVTLIPYLRRLVVTGLDFPGILHGFFGDDWAQGVGPLHEQERRNYLFAAKSGGWAVVKKDYDMLPLETVPFLRPLQAVSDSELVGAERTWSDWLAMEDWMVGPRAPREQGENRESTHEN